MPLELKDLQQAGVWHPKNGDVVFFQLEKSASEEDFAVLIDNLKGEADMIYENCGARVRFLVLRTGIHLVELNPIGPKPAEDACPEKGSCAVCRSTDHSDPGDENGAA